MSLPVFYIQICILKSDEAHSKYFWTWKSSTLKVNFLPYAFSTDGRGVEWTAAKARMSLWWQEWIELPLLKLERTRWKQRSTATDKDPKLENNSLCELQWKHRMQSSLLQNIHSFSERGFSCKWMLQFFSHAVSWSFLTWTNFQNPLNVIL